MRSGIRSTIRLLLMVLVIAAIVPFTLSLRDGRPLLSLADLRRPQLPELPAMKLPQLALTGASEEPRKAGGEVIIYRWRGGDGSWQFCNEAPPAGIPYESIAVDPDANLIQGVDAVGTPPPRESGEGVEPAAPGLPLTLSPEQIGKLFDTARGVQRLTDERQSQLEKAGR